MNTPPVTPVEAAAAPNGETAPGGMSAEVALAAVTEIIDSVVGGLDLRAQSGDALLATAARVERVGRWVDALRVAAAAEIGDQSRAELGSEGLAAQRGCRTANELLQRVARVSGATAARWLTLGSAIRSTATLAGYEAPPRFAAVADALAANVLGMDSAFAIVAGLTPVLGRSAPELWVGAEQELVAAATATADTATNAASDSDAGTAAVGGLVVCTPEETKLQAAVWRAVLDPDGVEPAEERALRKRGFRIGRERDGVVPVSGQLVPVAAAMLSKVFTACMSPRTAPAFLSAEETAATAATTAAAGPGSEPGSDPVSGRVSDPRSLDQQRHDILVGIIEHATRSADTPTVGGAAPTVLVTIRERDLRTSTSTGTSRSHPPTADAREADPTLDPDTPADAEEAPPSLGHAGSDSSGFVSVRAGVGFVEGVSSLVSAATVCQFICAGGIQTVTLNDAGRVISLGSQQRCFTGQQRRAITIRDGGCLIPGCGIPAAWCEIHHVTEAARGGPTHTDNGALLCWFHHRTIDTSGWQIRIRHGIPQVKAPNWIQINAPWQPVTRSPTRLHNALDP